VFKYNLHIFELVNASQAGEGNLEAVIMAGTESVPSTLKNLGNGNYDLTFTPHRSDVHLVTIKFNGEMIPGRYLVIVWM